MAVDEKQQLLDKEKKGTWTIPKLLLATLPILAAIAGRCFTGVEALTQQERGAYEKGSHSTTPVLYNGNVNEAFPMAASQAFFGVAFCIAMFTFMAVSLKINRKNLAMFLGMVMALLDVTATIGFTIMFSLWQDQYGKYDGYKASQSGKTSLPGILITSYPSSRTAQVGIQASLALVEGLYQFWLGYSLAKQFVEARPAHTLPRNEH